MLKKRPRYSLADTAQEYFRPFIDLAPATGIPLMSEAVVDWSSTSGPLDWGALMVPGAHFRRMLRAGGLPVTEDDFLAIQTVNPDWINLLDALRSGSLEGDRRLRFSRWLLYLGYPDAARKLLNHAFENSDERLMAVAIGLHATRIADPTDPLTAARQPSPEVLRAPVGRALYHLAIQGCSATVLRKADSPAFEVWAGLARRCITDGAGIANDPISTLLATRRLDLYIATHEAITTSPAACYKRIDDGSAELDTARRAAPAGRNRFLLSETLRRLAEFGLLAALEDRDFNTAWRYGKLIIDCDPYCSHGLMLTAEAAHRVGDNAAAEELFLRTSRSGILERPHSLFRLAGLSSEPWRRLPRVTCAAEQDIFISKERCRALINLLDGSGKPGDGVGSWLRASESSARSRPEATALPVRDKHVRSLLSGHSAGENSLSESLKNSEGYSRLRAFWELRPGNSASPYFAETPLIAYDVIRENREPWMETLYQQRTMSSSFRQELAYQCMPKAWREPRSVDRFLSADSLRGFSDEVDDFLRRRALASTSTPLERCRTARLSAYLGFADDASQILVPLEASESPTPERAYEQYTLLFTRHIVSMRRDADIGSALEHLYPIVPDTAECIRLKLNISILAIVWEVRFAGRGSGEHQRGESGWRSAPETPADAFARLDTWKRRADSDLNAYMRRNDVSRFEAGIMASRVLRATSFLPYLRKDQPKLRREMDACVLHARSLKANGGCQAQLVRDHLFATLESESRARTALGDSAAALKCMYELANEVDSNDSSAWLHLGDMQSKHEQLELAVASFTKAAQLGAPLGMVAWFRAGRCWENLGERNRAIECYLDSIRLWPFGLSPLQRIAAIAAETGDTALSRWANAQLDTMRRASLADK